MKRSRSTSDSKWEHIKTHEGLRKRLKDIRPRELRCLRMMGTFIGAAGSAELVDGTEEPLMPGLVDKMAGTLYSNWKHVQSMLLLGSCNRAVPIDQAPYQYYTYLFLSRVVTRLVGWLQRSEDVPDDLQEHGPKPPYGHLADQLVIRFTFVPEDILFAQFFFDEEHLIIAASYSWNTLDELHHQGAYAAVYMKNRDDNQSISANQINPRESAPRSSEPLYPHTSQRLLQIFDSRFREQSEHLGEEIWTLKRLNERDYGVLVQTPFWRETKSVLRAFEFDRLAEPQIIELGTNGLQRFIRQIEGQIGPSPK